MSFNKSLAYTATGKYLNINQKPSADVLNYDNVKWGFEVSEGDRPADPILPHKASPTRRVIIDSSLQRRPVVIPIGTIISALPVMSQSFYQSSLSALLSGTAPVPVSGESTSNSLAAGEVALGMGQDASTLLTAPVDDQLEAYGKINLAAVIANGGTTCQDRYHLYDYASTGYTDETARYDEFGAVISASSRFMRHANVPIGVVTEDIFLDDQGAALNFTSNNFQKFSSFQTDYYVEMPYVILNYDAECALPTAMDWYGDGNDVYNALMALGMPILFADSITALVGGLGKFVKPELNGKFYLDSDATNKTIQHVGKLTSVNNKFPADLEDLVMVPSGSATGGTDTYGIPYRLFIIADTILNNKTVQVASPTYAQITALIDQGYVGMARINLHVS